MSPADFVWTVFYLDLLLIPFAWWMNSKATKREVQRDNAYLAKLAAEHPEQWRKNE